MSFKQEFNMKFLSLCSLVLLGTALIGCGDSEPEPEKAPSGHVWKSQTDTIQTAKDTAADLEKTLQKRDQKINQ